MDIKQVFDELISTIERNAVDNKVTITDVKLWAKSWREEADICEHNTDTRYADTEADGYYFCGKCGKMRTP